MPMDSACPDWTSYERLAAGELLSPDKEAVLQHLEGCDACATRVEALPENDTLVDLIRQASRLSEPARGEAVASLVQRVSKLRPAEDSSTKTNSTVLEAEQADPRKYSFLPPRKRRMKSDGSVGLVRTYLHLPNSKKRGRQDVSSGTMLFVWKM